MKKHVYIENWKEEVKRLLNLKYGKKNIDNDKMEQYIDKIIADNLVNPEADMVNNYSNVLVQSNLLEVIDFFTEKNLIISPSATLFRQHDGTNPLVEFISELKILRNVLKKKRKVYDEFSSEWRHFNLGQLNKKLKLNILYGSIGYPKFHFHNIFLAEATTFMGKNIISSAAMGFENFIHDNVLFNEETELYTYINNISSEYKKLYRRKVDLYSISDIEITPAVVYKRLLTKIAFNPSDLFKKNIKRILSNRGIEELTLLYYKNNLDEFNRQSYVMKILTKVINNTEDLLVPEADKLRPDIKKLVDHLWDLYRIFVFYNYGVYDRIRKTLYTKKKAVLYIDTDSNFIGLDPWITFTRKFILNPVNNMSNSDNEDITISNIMIIFLSNVVSDTLFTMAKGSNIADDEWAKIIAMKNEFINKLMLFTQNKKNYISLSIIQEGKLLYDEGSDVLGTIDIKGLPFKKATTKSTVKKFFTELCETEIMRNVAIDPEIIYMKLIAFQKEIEESMRKGESTYYKQASVHIIDAYKKPYSISGVKSIMIWNALEPTAQIDLPAEVDIIPILDLSKKSNLDWFESTYPEKFKLLEKEILLSDDERIRKMKLNSIAKPRNSSIKVEPWLRDLIDTNKITNDTLSLFSSVMKALDVKILNGTGKKEYYTNIVEL